jgi:hypothetical protein
MINMKNNAAGTTDHAGAPEQGDPLPYRGRWDLPGRDAIVRFVGAVLAEQNDEWTQSRRYMGTDILAACRKTAQKERAVTEVISEKADRAPGL